MHHVEAVVEVLAKVAHRHFFFDVAVGGGDDAYVHVDGLGRAHRPHLLLLQHAQELGLQGEGHVADLVQEQRSPLGGEEEPLVATGGAGESPFHMPEQLRFQQVLGDGGAVDGDEGLVAPGAGPVDGARQQLLAGARLAVDEHTRVAGGHQARLGEHRFHLRAAGDDARAPGGVFFVWSLVHPAEGQGLLDLGQELLAVEGLGEEAEHAAVGGLDGVGDSTVGGEDDDRQGRVFLVDGMEQGYAIHTRHAQVGDHQVGAEHRDFHQGLLGAVRHRHVVTGVTQAQVEQAQEIGVVVDDEDPGGIGHGRSLLNHRGDVHGVFIRC